MISVTEFCFVDNTVVKPGGVEISTAGAVGAAEIVLFWLQFEWNKSIKLRPIVSEVVMDERAMELVDEGLEGKVDMGKWLNLGK